MSTEIKTQVVVLGAGPQVTPLPSVALIRSGTVIVERYNTLGRCLPERRLYPF